jgi:hypothetical protein
MAEVAAFRSGALVPSAITLEFPSFSLRPVWIALAISFAAHLLVLVYLSPEAVRDRPPTRLSVELSLPAPSVAPVTPAPAEPRADIAASTTLPVAGPRVPDRVVRPTAVAETIRHRSLNLSLPSTVFDAEPQAARDTNGPFDPDIAKAVAKRQETRTRVGLAARRRAQREGVSIADYERGVAAGHTIKTDGGCFDLRNEQSRDANGQMWWRTPCREAHASVWEQAEISEAELHPSLRKH